MLSTADRGIDDLRAMLIRSTEDLLFKCYLLMTGIDDLPLMLSTAERGTDD